MTSTPIARPWKQLVLTAALAGTVVTGGCGGFDGVALEGGIFDVLGVSESAKSSYKEPRLEQRAGLVLPPDPQRLPEPGSGASQQQQLIAAVPQWPTDPDVQRRQQQSALQKQHDEYCARELARKRALKERDTHSVTGPLGRCETSLLSGLNLGGNAAPPADPRQTITPTGAPR